MNEGKATTVNRGVAASCDRCSKVQQASVDGCGMLTGETSKGLKLTDEQKLTAQGNIKEQNKAQNKQAY